MRKGISFAASLGVLALSTSALDARAEDKPAPPPRVDSSTERVTDTAKPLLGQPGAFSVGGFVFRLSLELRTRGEAWSDAVSALFGSTAVLGAKPGTGTVQRDARLLERARLGLAVEKGPVTGVFRLEDARSFGDSRSSFFGSFPLAYTAPYEAYLEAHTLDRVVFFRAGRQEIVVGDGRLVGNSDDSPTGKSLDALRLGFRVRDFDVQVFAAMLAAPGNYYPPLPATGSPGAVTEASGPPVLKPGAQLYAVDATWHIKPVFKAELTGLARITRQPAPSELTPSDTFVGALRFFGDYRGFRYSAIGAFEGGQVAIVGDQRKQIAGAAAVRADWETALPGHLTFGVQGAYASGDDDSSTAKTDKTFDPILPDTNAHFGQSGFYAWTNLIEVGGDLAVKPVDALRIRAGYRYAALADPNGTWFSSSLVPVGATSGSDNGRTLGHVIEGNVSVTPWEYLRFMADYAAMITGDRGESIIGASVVNYGRIQAELKLP